MSEKAELIIRFLDKRTPAEQERILHELADKATKEEQREQRAAEQKAAREARVKELTNTVNTLGSDLERVYKSAKPGSTKEALKLANQYSKAFEELQKLQGE